jgi:hypothetical protein
MPSRPLILAILAFWLATTTWLIYREILPGLQSGEPPPYSIDLADEVSAQSISWRALQDGKDIGTVLTQVRRQPDHTFALDADFKADRLNLLGVEVKNLRSRYTVTRGGDLRELSIMLKFLFRGQAIELGIAGKVEQGVFSPALAVEGIDVQRTPLPKLNPVPVAGHGNILNPLHPLNRLRGLRAKQRWIQPVVDPLMMSVSSLIAPPPVRQLEAEVDSSALFWNEAEVLCWRIDYRERADKVAARTWVRREDGLVLQQEASHAGRELVLQRIVAR